MKLAGLPTATHFAMVPVHQGIVNLAKGLLLLSGHRGHPHDTDVVGWRGSGERGRARPDGGVEALVTDLVE